MPNASISCIYCGASNPVGANRCVACGAPIDIPVTPPVRVTVVNTPRATVSPVVSKDTTPEQIRDALEAAPINNSLKEGLMAAGAGLGTLGIGTFFARTAAEAASIAFSAFMVGYFAAATGNFLIAAAGGLVIGLTVGLVVKRPLAVLLSAPLGTIAGLAAGYFLQSSMPGWPLIPLLGTVGGALLGLLGGKRGSTSGVAKWYTRFRPLLGMGGGLLFAVLGYVIG